MYFCFKNKKFESDSNLAMNTIGNFGNKMKSDLKK